MKIQDIGYKPQNLWRLGQSNETTITIKKGAPVFLSNASGKGGFGVKSCEGLAVSEQGFFFGLATKDVPPGVDVECVYGYYEFARVIIQSRAASTDVWASAVALSLGGILTPITASSVQALSQSGAGSAITNRHAIILAETLASITTQASSITAGAVPGLLYSTAYKKVWIAIM